MPYDIFNVGSGSIVHPMKVLHVLYIGWLVTIVWKKLLFWTQQELSFQFQRKNLTPNFFQVLDGELKPQSQGLRQASRLPNTIIALSEFIPSMQIKQHPYHNRLQRQYFDNRKVQITGLDSSLVRALVCSSSKCQGQIMNQLKFVLGSAPKSSKPNQFNVFLSEFFFFYMKFRVPYKTGPMIYLHFFFWKMWFLKTKH